jgi:hypothetical protein
LRLIQESRADRGLPEIAVDEAKEFAAVPPAIRQKAGMV